MEKLIGIDRSISADSDWHIIWRSAPAAWLLWLVIIPAVLLLVYYIYRRERAGVSNRSKFLLSALRAGVIMAALLILFQPAAVLEKPITRESTLALLVDDSFSMNLRDRYLSDSEVRQLIKLSGWSDRPGRTPLQELSRIDLVNAILSNPQTDILGRLAQNSRLKTYAFSGGLRPLAETPGEFKVKASGESTAIGNALSDLVNDSGGRSLGGAVLISDGRHNQGRLPLEVLETLKQSGRRFPVYTVLAGASNKSADIELSELAAPQVGVVNDEVVFNFTIRGSGFPDRQPVKVTLSERKVGQSESGIVSESVFKLPASERLVVGIKYKPGRVGDYIYEISAPLLDGEIISENNVLEHYLKVVDNTIRVLYLDSYPRWEYRRLKNALIRDRTIKASIFLLSADPDFPQDASAGLAPLTQFPSEPRDLFNYDVIIWGDVNPGYLSPGRIAEERLMENLKRFVGEMGGGIAFICGDRFNPSGIRKSPLMELFPLIPEDDESPVSGRLDGAISESFRLKLTAEGQSDPIMRLEDDPSENSRLWETMPGLYWYARFQKAKPAARVLAVHPMSAGKFGLRPVMAAQYYGKGRVFLSATDETWRWCSVKNSPSGQPVGEKYFYGFWNQAIRFLRGGRLLGSRRIQLNTDRPVYQSGQAVKITAKIYDPEFKPLKQPSYPVAVGLVGAADGSDAQQSELALNAVPDKEGQYDGSFTPARPGFYKIIGGSEGMRDTGQGAPELVFYVHQAGREYEQPLPNPELLRDIARASDGAFLKITEMDKLPDIVKPVSDIIYTETKEDDIWDKPIIFILFLLIISLEWVIRKLVGLI